MMKTRLPADPADAARTNAPTKSAEAGFGEASTPSPGVADGARHVRLPRHLRHLPRDYELAIRWLRPSFLIRDHWTPGRKGRDIHGLATLRYLDQGEAALRAA